MHEAQAKLGSEKIHHPFNERLLCIATPVPVSKSPIAPSKPRKIRHLLVRKPSPSRARSAFILFIVVPTNSSGVFKLPHGYRVVFCLLVLVVEAFETPNHPAPPKLTAVVRPQHHRPRWALALQDGSVTGTELFLWLAISTKAKKVALGSKPSSNPHFFSSRKARCMQRWDRKNERIV